MVNLDDFDLFEPDDSAEHRVVVVEREPRIDTGNQWRRGASAEARFWARVHKGDGCWEVPSSRDHYPSIVDDDGRALGVHRFSWQLHNGPIPPGLDVCHRCDNQHCVRPDHLFVGTRSENLRDMVQKGRGPLGERNHAAKLTAEQVRFIRSSSESARDLATRFGIGPQHVRRLRRGARWSHV